MTRVIAYIDGFNLYHAIDELNTPHLKWLDLWALSASIVRKSESLAKVYYFSAYPNWKPASAMRHKAYVRALEYRGVTCELGHFKERQRKCYKCRAVWPAHEEKETDVHMGARIVADSYENRFDRAIIITADSDLVPALKIVQSAFPEKELFVAAPPKRRAHARALNPKLEITRGRLAKCRLPEKAQEMGGPLLFECPSSYALPRELASGRPAPSGLDKHFERRGRR